MYRTRCAENYLKCKSDEAFFIMYNFSQHLQSLTVDIAAGIQEEAEVPERGV